MDSTGVSYEITEVGPDLIPLCEVKLNGAVIATVSVDAGDVAVTVATEAFNLDDPENFGAVLAKVELQRTTGVVRVAELADSKQVDLQSVPAGTVALLPACGLTTS